MKTSKDPRHQKRRERIKALFAASFTEQKQKDIVVETILKNKERFDKEIEKSAPDWPTDKLNKLDLAVLRLAIYELEEGKNPPKVIIDEAVELAKEFGSENSASFVNGVLGTIYKEDNSQKKEVKENKGNNNKEEEKVKKLIKEEEIES